MSEFCILLDGSTVPGRERVGGKAHSLAVMRSLGLPCPPAFVVPIDVCIRYLTDGREVLTEIAGDVRRAVAHLEHATGRSFGGDTHPLLLSVRSGGAVSMPGMMDTILNVGLTVATAGGLAHEIGARATEQAQASFRRMYRDSVSGHQPVPDEPWTQLFEAIAAVFESWRSPRAVAYRSHRGLTEDGGTAVTVQAMVFGHLDDRSGTGVYFTRDPLYGAPGPYGEWLPTAQGEDLVSGSVRPLDLDVLRQTMPSIHAQLISYGDVLERHHRDAQDIEFTVESGELWLLQTRTAKRTTGAAVRIAVDLVDAGVLDPMDAIMRLDVADLWSAGRPHGVGDLDPSTEILAQGEGACPGVGSGVAVWEPAEAEHAARRGEPAVLMRPETSPDDVRGMLAAAALVTEIGGKTSHAAVVSREAGVPCVVGCGADSLRALVGRRVVVDGSAGVVLAADARYSLDTSADDAAGTRLEQLGADLLSVHVIADSAREGSPYADASWQASDYEALLRSGASEVYTERRLPVVVGLVQAMVRARGGR